MERPDSVLPTLGGQTGLNLAMALARDRLRWTAHGVQSAGLPARDHPYRAEDRQRLQGDCMEELAPAHASPPRWWRA